MKFCHTFRYGLFLEFVFQHLPGPNRARLLVVYVVSHHAPYFPYYGIIYVTWYTWLLPKPTRSQVPVAFGISGHVTTKHLPDTPC